LRYPLLVADNYGNLHLEANGYNSSADWDVVYFFNPRPLAPVNLDAIDDQHPKFKWSPSEECNFDHYEVLHRWRSSSHSLFGTIDNVEDTVFTDTTLWWTHGPSSDHAYYRVLAVNTEDVKSDSSATLTFNLILGGDAKPVAENVLSEFALSQIYANPLNAQTTIEYSLPQAGRVTLEIYDLLGRKVETLVDEMQEAGRYKTNWNARSNPSGLYFAKLVAGQDVLTRKVTLLK
jgi:hypothetical protein